MSWDLWVHAGNAAKEGVPALLEVANVGNACTTSDINVLDFMEPAHTEDTSLTAHVECLQVIQVHLGRARSMSRTHRAALAR